MNFLLAIFGNRRKSNEGATSERRHKGALQRHREIAAELDAAVRNLDETVQLSAPAVRLFRERLHVKPSLAHDSPWSTVEFSTFAEACIYRKPAGRDGIASVCTHPEHEAAATGIASCCKSQCPHGRKK